MTVRMALARGGGLTDRGSAGRLSVYRDGQKIKADLDTPVRAEDKIRVGERFF
jgi:polysaccharide export outer membrane protein